MAGESAAGIVQETGILDRGGTDDHVTDAVVEAALDGIEIADTAAELHGNVIANGLHDFLDRPLVFWLTGKSAVEIDHVQAARSLGEPMASLVAWRTGEDSHLVHEALFETDALSLFQVNRGNDQHIESINERSRNDEKTGPGSGLPGDKIGQHGEPGQGAFFRVALNGEDIIPRDRAGKGDPMIGRADHAGSILSLIHI